MNSRPRRKYIEFHDLTGYGFPEVPLFGAYRFDKATDPLSVHTHKAFEICFLVEGRQNYRVFGRDYLLKGGDLFITRPDEPHSTGKQPQEKGRLYWLHLMPVKKNGPFLGLHPSFGCSLFASLSAIEGKCFPGSPKIRSLFEELHGQLAMPDAPARKLAMANLLVSIILEIIVCSSSPQKTEDRNLNRIIQHINENIRLKLKVPQLAAFMGMSVSWFKCRFKEETGMPPAEYVLRLKISRAKEFLESGRGSVSEAGMHFNFSSSQHFATAFKRFSGQKPSACRSLTQ